MSRRLLTAAVAAAVVLLLALGTPAAAKGPDTATLSGPGVGTKELTLADPDRSLNALMRLTRFWEGAGVSGWDLDPPAGDLGPRFSLTYHVPGSGPSGHDKPIHQDLYPFATGGPVVYAPPGQAMYGMDMSAGWLATDQRLARVLTRLGATGSAESPASEPASEPALEPALEPVAAASDRAWAPIAIGAGVVLLGAVVLTRRRWGVAARHHS